MNRSRSRDLQPPDVRPIARNPILLAEMYFSGLGKKWRNQKALEIFRHLKPAVSRQDLSRAIGVQRLPQSVRSLFDHAGIWSETARELVSLSRKHGAFVLAERARHIEPEGFTWHQIVALLDGREPAATKRRVRSHMSPLLLAATYRKGLVDGQWDSLTSAAEKSGWHKSALVNAVAVSELPSEILRLFEGKTLSRSHGESLLKVYNAIGEDEFVARAKEMLDAPKRRTTDQIIAYLLSVREASGIDLRIRERRERGTTRFVFEFSVDAKQADELMLSSKELAPIVHMALAMIRTRKAKETVAG